MTYEQFIERWSRYEFDSISTLAGKAKLPEQLFKDLGDVIRGSKPTFEKTQLDAEAFAVKLFQSGRYGPTMTMALVSDIVRLSALEFVIKPQKVPFSG